MSYEPPKERRCTCMAWIIPDQDALCLRGGSSPCCTAAQPSILGLSIKKICAKGGHRSRLHLKLSSFGRSSALSIDARYTFLLSSLSLHPAMSAHYHQFHCYYLLIKALSAHQNSSPHPPRGCMRTKRFKRQAMQRTHSGFCRFLPSPTSAPVNVGKYARYL